ncbi:MAG: RNA 2',3'-cyclic phosphodiesterase [Motiliproteus sp.]
MTIRSFLAVPLKSSVVRRLANYADTLCSFDSQGRVRWSDSNSYHLTLGFLGEINLDQVAQLEHQARLGLQQQCSFQLHLDRVGYLQVNPELAVLAALSDTGAELVQLQRRVVEIAAQVGLPLDHTGYQPHVTLGRLPVGAAFDHSEPWPRLDQSSLVDAVVLYQSKPGATGSIYTPLFDIALASQGVPQAILS